MRTKHYKRFLFSLLTSFGFFFPLSAINAPVNAYSVSGWPGTAVHIVNSSLDPSTGIETLMLDQTAPSTTCSVIFYLDAYTTSAGNCSASGTTVTAHFINPPTDNATFPGEYWILFEDGTTRYGYTDTTFTVDFNNPNPTPTLTPPLPHHIVSGWPGTPVHIVNSSLDPNTAIETLTLDQIAPSVTCNVIFYPDAYTTSAGNCSASGTTVTAHFINPPTDSATYPGEYWILFEDGTTRYGYTDTTFTVDFGISINNPPSIGLLSHATINEGSTYSSSDSFTDLDSTSWTATVDYGDGSGAQNLSLSGQDFSLNHQYKDEGIYTIIVNVTDNQGSIGTETATVTVNDASPIVGTATISPNPVQVNSLINATATFTEAGVFDTHYATANWGDGTNTSTVCSVIEPSGTTPGSVSCPLSTGYTAANVYPITITVYDNDNMSGESPISYASVYSPIQASIFSAGQLYDNPSTASWNTSGRVKFGLSYKYHGGMATGDKTFTMDFNAANLHFNATSISYLVISNDMATLQGSGTLNGNTGYNFLVVGVNKGGIRIQITDSLNNVVYDTQPNDPSYTTPTTSVTGNVRVH